MEKNLGHATAYGYAKSKGYSGTEEEFAQLMADYASVGQSAAQSAEQAAASATSASGSAATAASAAQTATSKASEAVTAAGTATTKASEASTSADTASAAATSAITSAQTATTASATATTKASEAAVSATTATAAKTDAETARDAAAQSASEAAASAESIDPEALEHKAYGAYVVESASGAIASFADGADNIPMKDVLVHIEPVQEGSGDPSPTNVRPITGWTEAKVTRTGKNLINIKDFTLVKGVHRTTGIYMYVPCPMNIVFSVNVVTNTATDVVTLSLRDIQGANYTQLGQLSIPAGTTGVFQTTLTLTTLSLGYLYCYMAMNDNDNATITITNIQIEVGSTATDYEPYHADTYDITFPSEAGAVYGGTLDVTKGELVVDRAQIASYNGEALPSTWISDRDVYSEGTTPTTGAQVCYYLATPITYQLTPQEITSLLGTNNLWADCGDTEVEYRADTEMYITKKITEVVSALS